MDYGRRIDILDNPSDNVSFRLEKTNIVSDDLEGSFSTTVTLEVINACKIKIIRPFNIMLTMVGWRSLTTQVQCHEKCQILIRIIDKAIFLLFISLLIFSYTYEALTCRFEKNTREKIRTIGPRLTTSPSIGNSSTAKSLRYSTSTTTEGSDDAGQYILCSHISTTYVIPSIIHLLAYILGMVHYRYNDNDEIYGLMEKTLQYSATVGANKKNYSTVIKKLTFWMWMALLWVLLAIVLSIIYNTTFDTYTSPLYVFQIKSKNIQHFLFVLDIFGFIIAHVVTVTIVLNYTIYCELVKFYVNAISKKMEMRSISVNIIKNDIQNVDGSIGLINGMIGKMMSLIFILVLNLLIVGIINLLISNKPTQLETAYRFLYVIHLILLLATAMIQCVRVNLAISSFKKWARHMSVFGYRKENKKQLDSFLLFTMGYRSRVNLVSYPLECWQMLVFLLMLGFILITLIQTGVMDKTEVFKYL